MNIVTIKDNCEEIVHFAKWGTFGLNEISGIIYKVFFLLLLFFVGES